MIIKKMEIKNFWEIKCDVCGEVFARDEGIKNEQEAIDSLDFTLWRILPGETVFCGGCLDKVEEGVEGCPEERPADSPENRITAALQFVERCSELSERAFENTAYGNVNGWKQMYRRKFIVSQIEQKAIYTRLKNILEGKE